ncbi:MAG: type VI secretion system contractile sheath large subunit [Candidatus Thiodiazotropha sp.]
MEIETLDVLMAKLQPSMRQPGSAEPALIFNQLDSFHPDHLISELPEPENWLESDNPQSTPSPQQVSDPDNAAETDQQALSRLLGKQPIGMARRSGGISSKSRRQQDLINSVVENLTNQATSQDTSDQTTTADHSDSRIQADRLRGLLQEPEFRNLESRWRSLDWLLRNNPYDPDCPVYLLDFPTLADAEHEPQTDDFNNAIDALHQRLARLDPSENQLILIFDQWFNPTAEDIERLNRLGEVAKSLDALLIAGADDAFVNLDMDSSEGSAWQAFRQQDVAAHLMLSLPGLLLRLPYGRRYEPIEHFEFEEWTGAADSSALLWGNPAYALSLILLSERMEDREFQDRRFIDWPAFAYPVDDEMEFQPATKSLYSEQDLQRLLQLGLVPAVGSRRQNSVQFPWLQTLKVD